MEVLSRRDFSSMRSRPVIDRHFFLFVVRCFIAAIAFAVFGLSQSTHPSAANKPAQAVPTDKPAFDEEPHFTVSGVKDTTNLGGHGSDTIVHERNSLAKETASLEKDGAAPSPAATLESLRQKVEREPDNASVHHMLADAEEKSGDALAAVREYQRAAELDPREDYIFDWGTELLLHHAPEPALEIFTGGTRLSPRSVRMMLGLGAAEFTLGEYDRAVDAIAAASDLDPKDPAPYSFLGRMLTVVEPSSALTERLRRFSALQPDRADANYYYALALWKRGKNAPAANTAQVESLLSRAVQIDAKYGAAFLLRGILHAERGDDADALADYQSAATIDPALEDAHYRLAQAYRRVGADDKAKAEVKVYEQLRAESQQQAERERHEIRQFVYTLRDQKPSP